MAPCAVQVSAAEQHVHADVVTVDQRMSQYDAVPGQVIVKFRNAATAGIVRNAKGRFARAANTRVDAAMRSLGVESAEQLMPLSGTRVATRNARGINGAEVKDGDLSGLYCLTLNGSSADEAVKMLQELPEVEFAEPNYRVTALANQNSNDPHASQQWGLNASNIHQLCNKPLLPGAKRPVVAIIDTGVDISHPDLAANIWTNAAEAEGTEGYDDDSNGFADDLHGWDFVNNSGRMRDNNGHGTHCAGIAGAVGGNGIGITGANPDALIMPIAVLQSNGQGDMGTLIKGIDYATANGADVISMSLGSYATSIALEQALGKAYQKSVLVAAAGNDCRPIEGKCPICGNFGAPMFPAAYTFVLGVEATQNGGGRASFSNYDNDGPFTSTFGEDQLYNYELKAPGAAIVSTFPGGQYKVLNGTSMATPLVAGGISRLISAKEYRNKEELFGDLIYATSTNTDFIRAYNISDADRRPTLALVTYRADDSAGDNDGRPDAGETIKIYPTLRNAWGNAENIRWSLRLADTEDPEIVSFATPGVQADFGSSLSSYAKATAATPLQFTINPACTDGRVIRMVLTATCDKISEPLVKEIEFHAENGVELGGVIAQDMTLTADKNYIVTAPIAIPENVTLTIEPGTVLKFRDGTGINCADGKCVLDDYYTETGERYTWYKYPNAGKVIAHGTPEKRIKFTKPTLDAKPSVRLGFGRNSELEYCEFEDFRGAVIGIQFGYGNNSIKNGNGFCRDLYIHDFEGSSYPYSNSSSHPDDNSALRLHIIDNNIYELDLKYKYSNYINNSPNKMSYRSSLLQANNTVFNYNCFNNQINDKNYTLHLECWEPQNVVMEEPVYFGSGRQDIALRGIYDLRKNYGWGQLDLNNMRTRPVHEAHGIVWKVVVDGYDAQDEFESLPPLGVGRHKFEVYFSRPMNRAKTPFVSMGVRAPYTQTAIATDGSWRTATFDGEDVDIYTAYLDIKGRDNFDGLNRIYVNDAEDDEYFPIPREDMRFNVLVQAAGSLSSGFEAVPRVGKVDLSWENPEANFDDMLGYNLYRYTVDDAGAESVHSKINENLLTTEAYTDHDVVPGTTYCYYYKVMTTGLTENNPSKIVAVTPKTAQKGDSNGSESVDVADVVTTLNYMTGGNPQPFIFDAADVNGDGTVNVLDVVATINLIMKPTGAAQAEASALAVWTQADGHLSVDCPVAIGGVQLTVGGCEPDDIKPLEALEGFETVKCRRDDGTVMVLAYSMSGRTVACGMNSLLSLPDGAEVVDVVLSDPRGTNITAIKGETTGMDNVFVPEYMPALYPNPFDNELTVPYSIASDNVDKAEIIVTDIAGRTVAVHTADCGMGKHSWIWKAAAQPAGVYMVSLCLDGVTVKTQRACKR